MELKFVAFAIMVCVSMGTTSPNELDRAEKNLLAVLGKTDRPPFIDRKKVQVPLAMLNLFQLQVNREYESTALPLPGRLAGAANTVRSLTHQGESRNFLSQFLWVTLMPSTLSGWD